MNTFSEGEVIVRDDLKYTDGALVVDGVDEEGCMLAHPLGGGFQLIVQPDELARFQRVEAEETIEVFSPGTFCIEGVEGEFEGWSDGTLWNGWEKPCFTRGVARQALEAAGASWTYDAKTDAFVVATQDSEDEEVFAGESVQLGDGGAVTAYFIGAGSWIWDKA